MEHAARAGDAAVPQSAEARRPAAVGKLYDHGGSHRGDTKAGGKASHAGAPDDAVAKAGEHESAKQQAGAHAAHSGQSAHEMSFVGLIFAAEQAGHAQLAPAAVPVARRDGKGASPAVETSEETPHAAAASDAPVHAGKREAGAPEAHSLTALSSASALADPVVPENSAGLNDQAGSPPAPPIAQNATNAVTSATAGSHGGAAAAGAVERTAAGGRKMPAPGFDAGQPRLLQAPQITASSPAPGASVAGLPASGVAAVASGQAAGEAGQAAAATAFSTPVPATPAALAAAVMAMQKAGDTSTVLSLDPAGLGAMTVHVSMDQASQVNVQFVASLAQTAHLLTTSMDDLRHAMTAAGIVLGQTSVRSDSGHASGNGGGQFSQDSRHGAASRSSPPVPAPSSAGLAEARRGGVSAYA